LIRNFQEAMVDGGKAMPGDLIVKSIEFQDHHYTSINGHNDEWIEVRIIGMLLPGGPTSKEERVAVELMED